MRVKRRTKRTRQGGTVALILSVALVISAFVYGGKICSFVSPLAVFASCTAMPQGSADYIKQSLGYSKETETKQTTSSAKKKSETTAPASSVSSVFTTPSDVQKMVEDYQNTYSGSEHTGAISEKQYTASSASTVYGNVFAKNTTSSHTLNIQQELEKKMTLSIKDKSKPSVLIFHTHTTESYEMADNGWYTSAYSTRSQDSTRNMVRVGDEIEKQLTAAGFNVIHDTTVHDLTYTGAYQRSRETITKILEENPTIQVVLDVHRDAIYQGDGTHIKPTAVINGKKSAQIMIIAGCEDGNVTDFPRWEENLVFAVHLHNSVESEYSGLMRPILFSSRKYNMDLTPCSLLVEFGSDSNTLEEAMYAGNMFGQALSGLLNEYVEK